MTTYPTILEKILTFENERIGRWVPKAYNSDFFPRTPLLINYLSESVLWGYLTLF